MQLDELPTIRDVLHGLYMVKGGASAQTKVTSTPMPTLPLDVGVLDLVDQIDDVIDRCAGFTVDALIRQPSMQFKLWRDGGWTMDFLDGVDRALSIGFVWRRADGLVGMTRQWKRRLSKCVKCNLRTMGGFVGDDFVTCSSCGGTMSLDEYERTTLIRARTGELPDLWTAQTVKDNQ